MTLKMYESMSCEEKPEQKEAAESRNKKLTILLAAALGLTIVVGGLLDLLAQGIPLGFTIPIINAGATLSFIIYNLVVISASVYISYVGLKELIIERRFSVEFLMAVAALGAVYLTYISYA